MTAGDTSKSFLWGAATAAHQVEGHQHNNWTAWEPAHIDDWISVATRRYRDLPQWQELQPAICDSANYRSGIASDHYRRFHEDIALMQELELNSYRFSIEWSRIEPQAGQFDQAALNHYRQVLKALRAADIEPVVTLHHFTDPVWLEAAGGWHGPDFPRLFARYTEQVVRELGDLVTYWVTINEPESYLMSRYFNSPLWPGWPHQERSLWRYWRARRGFIAAHKAAYCMLKQHSSHCRVGFSHGVVWFEAVDWWLKPFAWWLDYLRGSGGFRHTRGYQDFLGVQYYTRGRFKARLRPFREWEVHAPLSERSDVGWAIYPEGLYRLTQKLKRYQLPLYITENGIADRKDEKRAAFITDHLAALERSRSAGADIRGYFYWSLLDNYEWSSGFWPQFGLIEVNRETLERSIRPSAYVYREYIRSFRNV